MISRSGRFLIAGSDTLAGKAIAAFLHEQGALYNAVPSEQLLNGAWVYDLFSEATPDYVLLVAGKSGGILANQKYPAELMRENLMIQTGVLEAARRSRVKKLLFLASSCVYPKNCAQPMEPEFLMTGPQETTSQSYSLAKLAGLELCRAYQLQYSAPFITAISADAYGPEDSFEPEDSHVIPALISKFHHAAKEGLPSVSLWGTGTPVRDFICSRDLASACFHLIENYSGTQPVNISASCPISIKELASTIARITQYSGEIIFDSNKPDGAPAKILSAAKLNALNWSPQITLPEGLKLTYQAFLKSQEMAAHHA